MRLDAFGADVQLKGYLRVAETTCDVFACLGFYPVNPCGGEYVLGAPQMEKVEIELAKIVGVGEMKNKFHSRTPTRTPTHYSFTIIAKNLSKENKYVRSVTLNGRLLTRPIL